MTTIVEFPLHLTKPRRSDFYQELAEVVIFPGVWVERHDEASPDPKPRRPSGKTASLRRAKRRG